VSLDRQKDTEKRHHFACTLGPPPQVRANRPNYYLKPGFSAKMPAFFLADFCAGTTHD
jgi:hypothetical protein